MPHTHNPSRQGWLRRMIQSPALRYIVVGGCTTLVNFVVFTLCCRVFSIEVNVSNVLSVICSILFAYVANKLAVFRSHCPTKRALLLEFSKFVGARLITMIIEVGGVFVLYTLLKQDELLAKLATQIIVLVANYIISKFLVFTNQTQEK